MAIRFPVQKARTFHTKIRSSSSSRIARQACSQRNSSKSSPSVWRIDSVKPRSNCRSCVVFSRNWRRSRWLLSRAPRKPIAKPDISVPKPIDSQCQSPLQLNVSVEATRRTTPIAAALTKPNIARVLPRVASANTTNKNRNHATEAGGLRIRNNASAATSAASGTLKCASFTTRWYKTTASATSR
jgi:hypothetical protein